MNRTREDFCRRLLDESPHEALGPERLAARFVRYFDVPARPTMEQIKALLKRAGFGEVSGRRHLDVKGIHYSAPGGGYDIHYREDMWAGTQDYSVVHETYEIIYETLCDMDSGSPPDRIVCTQAERFAAAVLMQPRAFEPLALEWGLDVLKLQRAFLCSYASVTIRLAEVLRNQLGRVWHFIARSDSVDVAEASDLIVELRERKEKLEIATEEARALLKERQQFLDSADTIAAFAAEMSDFLKTSQLTETKAFVGSFVKEVVVKPGRAAIVYSIPTPDDSPMGGADAAEIALNGRVMNSVRHGGPGRDRTCDQSVMSRPLYH